MLKKMLILLMCLSCALVLSVLSYAQDTTPAIDEKKADPATAPATVIIATAAKTYNDGITLFANPRVMFRLSVTDNMTPDKIEYKINEGAFSVYKDPFAITAEGKQVITYFATDKIGNKEAPKILTVTIDNTAPEIEILTSKPLLKIGDKLYGTKAISFNMSVKDNLSGVEKSEYSVNGKDYAAYASPFNVPTDGEIEIRAKSADNVTNATDIFSLKINDETGKEAILKETSAKVFMDNIAPSVQIKADRDFIQDKGKNSASVDYKYTVSAADNESGVQSVLIRLDGKGDFIPYEKEIVFTTNGDHFIEALAKDKVGNVSSTSVVTVYVDAVAPQSTIDAITDK